MSPELWVLLICASFYVWPVLLTPIAIPIVLIDKMRNAG
jgi:hypothetical protein